MLLRLRQRHAGPRVLNLNLAVVVIYSGSQQKRMSHETIIATTTTIATKMIATATLQVLLKLWIPWTT